MSDFVARFGQTLMGVGFFIAVGAQVLVFIRICKVDQVKAVLALILPGYVLYYMWRSENRMPRVFRTWILGVSLFAAGAVIVGIAV